MLEGGFYQYATKVEDPYVPGLDEEPIVALEIPVERKEDWESYMRDPGAFVTSQARRQRVE
eukprot:8735670-Lingulodinium_polyedra.AAC.1